MILVTGASGQVGSAVVRLAKSRSWSIWAPARTELDLAEPTAIESVLAGKSKSLTAVINCAAYTAVDRAESEPELAERVNALAPRILAEATAKLQIPLLHVSTDYVFDGSKESPYLESDRVNPISMYGKTKEAGEAGVRAANPNHAIIRTAWVLSAGGSNFLNTMLRLCKERREVSVVADQFGCPTSASDIASALLTIVEKLGERGGTWHFVNSGETTWYGLADYIFAKMARRGLPTPSLNAITSAEYPAPAKRPANSRLATGLIEQDFSIAAQPWQDAVDQILAERFF